MVHEVIKLKENGSKHPLKDVSSRHNVPSPSLSKWVSDPLLRTVVTPSTKRKMTKGRPLKFPDASKFIVDKTLELRDQKLRVTGSYMALQLKSKFRDGFGDLSSLQARRVVYRIFSQNNFTSRAVTNNQIILDEQQLGAAKIEFVQSFRDRVKNFEVPDDLVINMDETPSNFLLIVVYYDPEVKRTFDVKGSKKVSIRKSKTTSKASALLAVSLSGAKLIPFMVYIAMAKQGKVKKDMIREWSTVFRRKAFPTP
jgi:hypothetical protein